MTELTKEQKLKQLTLPYEEKLKQTKRLLLEWYLQFKGKVYVSFSGGKDSTVLLDIARKIKGMENVKAVFFDTGLEYPEIRNFVKTYDNVEWIKPKLTFKEVLEKYGYPIISKEQSEYINDIRNTKSQYIRDLRLNKLGTGRFALAKKWYPLIDAPFKISNKCCYKMKKGPAASYDRKTGYKSIVATMASESRLRYTHYMKGNCNAFSSPHPKSLPLSFWNEQDVLRYIYENKLPIASVYGDVVKDEKRYYKTTGVNRTGCMFCMYGLHLEKEPNRFERMKETHPYQYDYCMNKLGLKAVIEAYLNCAKGKK